MITITEQNEIKASISESGTMINQLNTSLIIKLILFSVGMIPKCLQLLIYFCSNLQILSVFANTALLGMPSSQDDWFRKALSTIHQIFSIADLFDFKEHQELTHLVLVINLIIIFSSVIALIYFQISLKMNYTQSKLAQKLWQLLLWLYTPCLFYPLHYAGLKMYDVFTSNAPWVQENIIPHKLYVIFIIMSLCLNSLFAWVTAIIFKIRIKTKSLLSSSITSFDIIDLLVKTVLPIFWERMEYSEALYATLLTLNLVSALAKDTIFFRFLPYYRVFTLQIAAKTHAVLTFFAFALLLPKIFSRKNINDNLDFSALLCLTAMPLFVYFYSKLLEKLLIEIATYPNKIQNVYYLIHYWEIYKHYAYVCKTPKPRVHGIDKNFFHHNIARIRLHDIQEDSKQKYNIINEQFNEDENASVIYDRIVNTIQQLVQTSDKSSKWLLKALLARFYLKYESLFILADDLLNQSLKNATFLPRKSSIYYLKLELLKKLKKKEVEEKLVENYQTTTADLRKNKLSIQMYLTLVNMCESQRKNMISQLKSQIQFWDKFQANQVNCQSLINLAEQVQNFNKKINKRWTNNYPFFTSVHYTKPILTYSFYLSFAQNDFDSGDKLIREYYHQALKHKRKNDESDPYFMTTELLSAEILFIVISGSPNSLGKVLDCSNNFERTFAFKRDFMIGRSINNLIPAFFAERHDRFMQSPHELIQARINRSKEVFVLDKNGFLATFVTYLTIRFLPEHGLCYYMLLKPPPENKESLLVHANGQILNFSQKFGEDLKLKNNNDISHSIFTICPDFEDIIQALTMSRVIVTPEKSEILENHTPTEFPSPPTLIKNQSSYSYSPSPNLFSPNVKKQFTFQTSKLQTTKDAYYQNIFQKYSAGAELNFYPLSKVSSTQGDKMAPFKGQAISYQAVIQVFTFDKETVFTVVLMKLDEVMNTIAFLPQTMDDTALLNQSPKRRRRRTTKRTVNFDLHDKAQPIMMNKKSLFDRFANLGVADPYDRVATVSAHLISEQPESLPSRNDLNFNSERHETNAGTGTTTHNELVQENASPLISSERQEALFTSRRILIESPRTKPTLHGGDLCDPEMEVSLEEPLNVLSPTSSQGQKNILDFKNNPIKEENIDGNYIDKQIAKRDYELELHSMSKKSVCHFIKQGIKAKRYRLSTFVFGSAFMVTMMLQLAFLIWMSFGAIQVSSSSQDTTAVIEALHLRIVWMNLANLETRFWNAYRAGWVPSYWGWQDLVDTQLICYGALDKYNKELISGVANLPLEYQAKFYEKNTKAIGRDSAQELEIISYDNTFQLTDKIIASGYEIIQIPDLGYLLYDFIDPISRFIYDNSYDDLLINSENLIEVMKEKLASDLDNSKNQIIALLSLILTLLTLFAAGAFAFVFTLNKEVKRFFIKLQTAQPSEIKKTLFLLTTFSKMLHREDQNEKFSDEPIQTYFSMRDKQLSEHSNEYNPKNNRKTISKSSLYKVYSRNYLYLFALYAVLIIVAFFVCFYYAKATNNIAVIRKQQNAVNVALDNMKKHSMISVQLEAMIMENATTTFQNVPILESLDKELENLNSGVELYNTFVRGQTVSPEIYSILYNRSCQDAYASEYLLPEFVAKTACMTVSSQSGYSGLIEIAAFVTTDLTNFVNEFLNSDRSRATLKSMNVDLTRKRIGSVDASMAFSFFLLNAVLEDSAELNQKFQDEKTLLAYVAIIISLLAAALSWRFIVKKLIQKELVRNDILALLPVKLICENQLLKRYVFNK